MITIVTSGATLVTLTLPSESGVFFPQQSLPPVGTGPGNGATTVMITPSPSASNGPIGASPTSSTTISTPLAPGSMNSRSTSAPRHVSTIVGSIIGAIVALIIIFVLCYRRRNRNRATGPILLADPFQDEVFTPPAEQQQRDATSLTTPSPFTGPIVTGASHSPSQGLYSPTSGKFAKQQGDSHGRDPSVSTSHSPPSISAQDSFVTMADLNTLRARILEVENLALRQRIADVENMARAGPSNALANPDELLQVPRASESPPEYASPLVEAPVESHA